MIRVSPLPVVPDLPQPGRTLVMGVVNVTPDSFSDGGEWFDPAAAITHGMDLLSEGADIIDVGGESTRPGAIRPEVSEELRRVLPVVRELAAAGACVSIDTMRAAVAEPAIAAGARLVNDVSGGRSDPGMLRLVADAGVPLRLHALARPLRRHAEQSHLRRCRGGGDSRAAHPARGGRPRRRRQRQVDHRSRVRVRQDGRTQLATAGAPRGV